MTSAVIFDMDGLLLDSEIYWERARSDFCRSIRCEWREEDELACKGKNSPEWAEVIRERCQTDKPASELIGAVSDRMRRLYDGHLPLLPGAVEAVRQVASVYPTGLASSSPLHLIDYALKEAGIRECFRVVVSADNVGRGKPNPDVFIVAAEKLDVPPNEITVFEDSTAGIGAGVAAGMRVIAVPNQHYPPTEEALASAQVVLNSLSEFRMGML